VNDVVRSEPVVEMMGIYNIYIGRAARVMVMVLYNFDTRLNIYRDCNLFR